VLDIQENFIASNDVSITAGDFNLSTATATMAITGTLTLSDQAVGGSGIGLGVSQVGLLNISTNELAAVTAGGLILQTNNGVTLEGDLNATVATIPLTINANTFNAINTSGTSNILLAGSLDFGDTTVSVDGALNITTAGSYSMNGSMTTTGAVSINAGTGIVMGAPSSVTTTNDTVTVVSTAGDIRLGLFDSGAANVSITASAGSILNNNGVFTDVTRSLTNIRAGSVSLSASNRIGISSSDAVTLDINPTNTIGLTFGADNAYVNNLQNARIVNNSAGIVVVGLIFSSQIIGIGQNIGSDSDDSESQLNQEQYAELLSDDLPISVLGADFKFLFGDDDEDEIVSTIIPSVPVLVKSVDGWEFVAPSRRQSLERIKENQKKGVKYIDWL
jgi:hypothetical protein